MKCTAIVITYNGMKWYDKCFGSLLNSDFHLSIIAVDNKSTDTTIDYLLEKYPQIQLIQNESNYGFTRANNIAIKTAYDSDSDYYFLLNQDAWIEKDTIQKLIDFSQNHSEYGIISPVHLSADKNHFDRGFLRCFNVLSETSHAYENIYLKKEQECYDTVFVNAAAWLITRKCLETVGGFDAIMFKHWGEDTNYCHRVLYHNFKIGIVPTASICHDRDNRQENILDLNISYAIKYANILSGKKVYIKRFLAIIIKIITIKHIKNGIKELFFVLINMQNIIKSRKRNKVQGEGLKYIFES